MATVREECPTLQLGESHAGSEEFEGFRLVPSRGPGGGVEIQGLDIDDARTALKLLRSLKETQYKFGTEYAGRIIDTMGKADIEVIPPAFVEQARRLADHRQKLLATPTYTMRTLGEVLRKKSASATRTWVSRKREKQQLFTVGVDRQVLIPAFQLNEDGSPRKDLAPILGTLLDGGVDGWSLWTWLTVGTPLLSGEVPEKLVASNPERVLKAASRFAAQNRRPGT